MRPASEVNSALELTSHELERSAVRYEAIKRKSENEWTEDDMEFARGTENIEIARNVLAWVMGARVDLDAASAWLVGFLLDDPDKLDNTPPEIN